jgi:Ca-activated chloride channel family protein
MSGDKIRNAKQAAKFIVDQLNPDDYFSVVMYDQTVDVVHEASRVENKQAIKLKIDRIEDRGSTNLMGGAMKGYEQVRKNYRSGYINRVLLLSDGLANEGITDAKQIERIVRKKSMDEGISISTFGVGNDYNEDLMTAMAESGTGNYYFISNAENIANIFKKELNGLKDIVAQDAELVVRIPDYVNIDKVYGFKYIQDGRTLRIKFRDVFASETKGVLIKYTVDANRNTTIRFDASLSFTDALTADTRRIALNNKNDYTDNRSLFQESYSEWVSAQVALYESNERLEMAMQEVDKGNYDEAKKIVKQNKEYMKSKAPLVNKSVELQKAESVNSTYDMQIKDVENMPQEDVKYMQKASKSSNYEIRTKK